VIFKHSNVSTYLRSVLALRLTGDPQYSLRTMARDLGISPAHLSQIINRKKKLAPRTRLKVAQHLGLDDRETRYFYLLVQLESAPSEEICAAIRKQLNDLSHAYEDRSLDADNFRVISDWYHVPILEMTYLDDFDCAPAHVAARLGISAAEAEVALERLVRLELLQVQPETGVYRKTDQNYVFRTSRRNEAFAGFLRQMMGLAVEAMNTQPFADRIMMSQTFCIDQSQLEEARQVTREYMQRMASLFDTAPRHSNAFQLNVQFFNLTDGRPKDPAAPLPDGGSP
jgi:uncharacterized protein (TIGR02147 family)